jgi:hypothetical protein
MQLPFKSSTLDFNLQGRDNSVVEYDWSEVIEYTRSKLAIDLAVVSTSTEVSLLEPRVTPHLAIERNRVAQDYAATLEEIDRISNKVITGV